MVKIEADTQNFDGGLPRQVWWHGDWYDQDGKSGSSDGVVTRVTVFTPNLLTPDQAALKGTGQLKEQPPRMKEHTFLRTSGPNGCTDLFLK